MSRLAAPLTITCPTCGACPKQPCRSAHGGPTSTHVARFRDSIPTPTPEERAERDRDLLRFQAGQAIAVRTTFTLSCGCVLPTSEPIPMHEWPVLAPGAVTACDEHDEYAIVVEVHTRMVADAPILTRLYLAAGLDDDTAEQLAHDQADEERAARAQLDR